MYEIIRLFYDITLFKKGPQDVPFSPFLTRITLLVYAFISFVMLFMQDYWLIAILKMGLDIVLLVLFTRLSLAWIHKSERYLQTLCALLGTDALITLAAIPASAVMLVPSNDIAVLAFFTVIGLMLWHWAVIGYILHQALEQPLGFSLGLALLYVMANYLVIGFLFTSL
jgi:hypothetical protein